MGAAGFSGAGAGLGAAGFGAPGFGRAVSAAGAGLAGVGRGPGRGAPGFGAGVGAAFAAASPSDLPNDSRSRRATGGSTVDDADLTNSPCSFRRASSSLLVTPSSFANSCTRALPATALLTDEVERPTARTTSGYLRWTFIAGASRCAHECSCLFFSECDVTVGVPRRRSHVRLSGRSRFDASVITVPWTRPADPALRCPVVRSHAVPCRMLDAEPPGPDIPEWDATKHLAREACVGDRESRRNLTVPSRAPPPGAVRQPAFAADIRHRSAP